jgi:DHA1 family bicyclomycin/chloramphenicol resistance-like MFS transporter
MDARNNDSLNPATVSSPNSNHIERAGIGFPEFVVLVAALSSVVALSIDIMLPVLPQIANSYAVTVANDRQAVLFMFMLGFGVAQVIFGPLSDRFGRKAVLIPGVMFYAVSSVAAAFADSFALLLLFRVTQGIGAASVRIVVNAIVRDCFGGRDMARVMSYSFMVFMIVPIVAPALGQWIAAFSSWQWIFGLLGLAGCLLTIWAGLRLRETLPREERLPFSFRAVGSAFADVISNRQAMGYGLSATLCVGCLFAFIISAEQIFNSIYDLGDWFPIAFALVAGFMALLNFANGHLVRRLGMRFISHGALIVFTTVGTVTLLVTLAGQPPFWLAYILLGLNIGAFALVPANFNALAMEPMGHIAGTASSVLGVITFTGGAILGTLVGQAFDGTLIPLATAFTLFGWIATGIVLWTERGRLFARPID